MKILYITLENISLHKGSAVHIKEIISGLRTLGHQVGLVAYSRGKFEKVDSFYNIHKFLILKKQSYIVSSLLLFICLFKALPKYDVIYARDYHATLISLIPRIIFHKKVVFEINGLANEEQRIKADSFLMRIFSLMIRWSERMATKYSDKIVAVTPQIAFYLQEHFNCSPKKVEIISNGVNTNVFYPIGDRDMLLRWRKRHGIGEEEIVLVFIGNLAPWQEVEDLIQVAPLILKKINNIKFLIVGDGILRKELEEKVKRLQLTQYFLFTGMVSHNEIPLYINFGDICIALKRRLKSGYSPIKLYEYMACGKPIIASRVEGLKFIESEEIGRLVEPKDIANLKEALFDLIENNQKRINMGKKCREIVQKNFSWNLKVAKIENILKGLA
jgi:starch synthase